MEQPNIPAGELQRIEQSAIVILNRIWDERTPQKATSVYCGELQVCIEGMKAEYLHSLQQPETIFPIADVPAEVKEWVEKQARSHYTNKHTWIDHIGDARAVFANGSYTAYLKYAQQPAGPVWVKASKDLPVFKSNMIRKAARKNDVFAEMRIDEKNVWFGAEGIRKDSPRLSKFLEGWYWLDESPSPRAAADREKEMALAFHKWVVEKDIWWEDEDEYWYKSISVSESLHGNYTEYEKVCETDDELYDLFLQSNP